MKIGLVGESPHDTQCIKILLRQLFPEFQYVTISKNLHGAQLEQVQPTKRIIRNEYRIHRPDVVVFIRDLDSLANDSAQITRRKE